MNKLSANLKRLLINAKLSENELSRRIGIPQQMINRIITGKNNNPKLETIMPIAAYFLVSVSQLIGDEDILLESRVSSEHKGWNSVPLLDVKKINADTIKSLIAKPIATIKTDIAISSNGFAITMNDDSMEPKFPKKTILVFDPEIDMGNGKFCLLYIHGKYVIFRQVFIRNSGISIKSLNPKYADFKSSQLQSNDKFLGVLVQAKINY